MKTTISLIVIISLLSFSGYMFLEPETVEAQDYDETVVSLTVTTEITIACDATCPLTGTINSISGGSATGTFDCNVQTPDEKGYSLTVKKSQLLLTGAGGADKQFDDIASTTPLVVDWPTPSAGNEVFGFNISAGTDAVARYKYSGAVCGSGAITADQCWDLFPTTTDDREVANRTASTTVDGVITTFDLKAQAAGTNNLFPAGYETTVTSTANINP